MQMRTTIAAMALALAAVTPAASQEANDSGIPTETQRRLAQGEVQVPWLDLIGLVGLLGLLGLRRRHPEDSYHPSPID